MKKIIVLLLFFFFCSFIVAQSNTRTQNKPAVATAATMKAGAFIDVNAPSYPQSAYTIQDLIKNVLITGGSNCTANVTNVIVSPNLAATNANRSWGYFNKGTTSFPFNDGVVLMTGPANSAGNSFIPAPLSGNLSTGGDLDLANALGVANSELFDATYIQFDFTPVTSEIKFNYIFASEEYDGNYQCDFSDGFALLLKKVTDPTYTNIAVLPNGTPVRVTNIHPYVSSSCPAINQQYFGGYNTANIETNFAGRTVPLTATATVIPGETYRFKMVLADYTDRQFDTGVFLQAGSFNIGVQFTDPSGNNLPSSISICEGSSQTLNASVAVPGATYQWFFNNNPIPGATNVSYAVTQPGVYSVEVHVPNTTCPGNASITVTTLPLPQAVDASLSICSPTSTATFNLTSAQNNISTTPGVTFQYYTNLADATAGNNNFITNPTSYVSGNAILFVRVNGAHCSDIAELQLTVEAQQPAPVITASGTVICGTGSVTLTSNYSSGNLWSTGETTQTISVTAPGVYSVTNTVGSCTSASASITITGSSDPNLQITGNTSFCAGGSTILTATADGTGNTFLWSTGATSPQVTIATSGAYTVTVTTPAGCQFEQSVTVSENPIPVVQNYSINECSTTNTFTFDLTSAEPNISTSPGVNFTYYTNLADANAGNASNMTTPATYNSGNAIIYVRVSNGSCFQIAELQLIVTFTPAPVITQSAPAICGSDPVILTSNYPTGNLWSTGETTQSITVTTPGNYSLTVSNGNCTSSSVSVNIAQNSNPNLSISGNTVICQGSSTTLTAVVTGTGYTFAWSNGSNAQSTSVNTAGTYTVTVTTPAGCQYTASATVTMDPPIHIVIAQPAQITCINTSVTLNASASTFSPGQVNILWTASAGGNIVSGANTLTPVVNQGGNYTLTITNTFGNFCSQQQTVTVIENNQPPVIGLTAGSLTICQGESVVLTASGAQTYTWVGLTGSGNTQTVSPSVTTTYTVSGVGANGCEGTTANITINVVPAIVSSLQDIQFCEGDSGTFDAGAGPGYTYLWSTGETSQTIQVDTAGTYTVTISNGVCSVQLTAEATYTPIPEIDEIIYEGNGLTINVKDGSAEMEYSIDNGINWQSSNVFGNILSNTTYYVAVRYKGVICYVTMEYLTFFVPNAITPNGDGINDFVDFTGVSKYDNFTASIYDRYGKEVFRAAPARTIWSGNYANAQVSTGTYWYQVTWVDPISKKTIVRKGWILVKNRD